MQIKTFKARAVGMASVLMPLLFVAGCSSICVDPDPRVCPTGSTNTSLTPVVEERSARPLAAPAPAAPAPATPPVDPSDAVQTAPVQLFDGPAADAGAGAARAGTAGAAAAANAGPVGSGVRIALLLPMNSPSLGGAAEAVRAGFMAGFQRDGNGVQVELVPTGDTPEDTLAAYARAAASHDLVVGPLARPAVSALAAGGAVAKPTIALNHPEQRGVLPRGMLVAGLSIEDEAAQVAEWAARERPQGRVLILTGGAAWAQRAAGAFEARWTALGRTGQRMNLPSSEGRVELSSIDTLKTRIGIDPPDLVFAALDVAELRQVVAQTGQVCAVIACYGGSSVNPGRAPGMGVAELNGLRLVDVPWLVRRDAGPVMVYPRPDDNAQPLYMSRLYALGIDAFRVARDVALRPGSPLAIDGVTGQLSTGGDSAFPKLQRREAEAIYQNGDFQPAPLPADPATTQPVAPPAGMGG